MRHHLRTLVEKWRWTAEQVGAFHAVMGTIERCIRLWSNEGELIVSPFAGIGSEGFEAIRLNRRFWGCELKPSYADLAIRNLRTAELKKTQGELFAGGLMPIK